MASCATFNLKEPVGHFHEFEIPFHFHQTALQDM